MRRQGCPQPDEEHLSRWGLSCVHGGRGRQPPEREPIVTHRLRRAVLAACLLALLSPTLARALPWQPSERAAAVGFLNLLRTALADLFGENGPGLDPDGATATGDAGSGLDPDGSTGTGDNGPGLAPNGG
jgi:hypothetical protein